MALCPVCKTGEEDKNFLETYTSSFNHQEYRLYHCRVCDLQWWEPLKIIPEFYEQEGDESYALFHMGILEKLRNYHEMFFKNFPLKTGKLLDVGCGDGVFLMHARKMGFDVWGIDFDRKSIQVCKEKGLNNTFVASPQEFADYCEKHNIKFDVITFFEVLEHQDDPLSFLEAVKRMLKPGGWIAGSVPNRNSFMTKMWRKVDLKGDFPPHHFLRFSETALHNTLTKKGFQYVILAYTSLYLAEIPSYIQVYLTGSRINDLFRVKILGSRIISEKTILYKKVPHWKKFIYKILRYVRLLLLFFPALLIKMISEGRNLYFHAKAGEVNTNLNRDPDKKYK